MLNTFDKRKLIVVACKKKSFLDDFVWAIFTIYGQLFLYDRSIVGSNIDRNYSRDF